MSSASRLVVDAVEEGYSADVFLNLTPRSLIAPRDNTCLVSDLSSYSSHCSNPTGHAAVLAQTGAMCYGAAWIPVGGYIPLAYARVQVLLPLRLSRTLYYGRSQLGRATTPSAVIRPQWSILPS